MAERIVAPKVYVIVCVVMVTLTVLSVGVSFAHIPGFWHLVIGLIIAACKASLVVLFFMHVLYSSRLIWIVVSVACFWLGLMFVLALNDYFTRGMIPFTPGH